MKGERWLILLAIYILAFEAAYLLTPDTVKQIAVALFVGSACMLSAYVRRVL